MPLEGSAMKRIFAMTVCWVGLVSGAAAADVGVSIQFSQPGVFGRVDIGQYQEPPQVIVPQPVIIAPPPPAVPPPEPVYLWVPIEHRKHWEKHCEEYHACGHPVYFVNHVWYRDHVLANRGHGEGRREEEGERGHHKGQNDEGEHGHGHDD
jgi:hypothetical protein